MPIGFSKDQWEKLQHVLDDVLEQPQAVQTSYLKKICGDDAPLYQEVKALLDAEQRAPTFLDRPAIELLDMQLPAAKPDFKSTRIGPYQLCEEIGQGGMGVVYRAERAEGSFEQQVAIKLLRNWNKREVALDRFQREQQFLASLTHPNIAQLYDGGITGEGQPYLVMEYVQGEPVTRYCDRQQLSIDARLKLLLQVIDALSFAHKNLIVHRDIKPSNILATVDGQIKLLDFGIAKLLGEQAASDLTLTGDQVMTPGYAAPEQLQNLNVTIATDIYQLGLVLYEMLTGKQAYRDRAGSFMELAKLMCEQAPTKPSVIVNLEILPTAHQMDLIEPVMKMNLSGLRGLESAQLQRKLKGDLDAIVLKMLRNEADQRYASMEAVRMDFVAYFENRPTLAQGRSFAYQTKKFMRRHWRFLSAGVLFIALLVIYAITVTFQAKEIQQALNKSILEKKKVQQVSDFLVNIFKAADPNVAGLDVLTAKELLDKGQMRIMQALEGTPEIQGPMLSLLGEIYFSQGKLDKSIQLLADALQRLRMADGKNDTELAHTLTKLATVHRYNGEYDIAKSLYEESLGIHDRLIRIHHAPESINQAETIASYGHLLRLQGDYKVAKQNLEAAIGIFERVTDGENEELASALNDLATLQHIQGEFEDARRNMEEAIRIQEKILGEEHSYFTVSLVNFAIMLTDMEYYDEAEMLVLRAIHLQKKILGDAHIFIASSLRTLGILSHRRGDLGQAEEYLRQELSLRGASTHKEDMSTAVSLMWLGAILQDRESYVEADKTYVRMMKLYRELSSNGEIIGRGLCQLASLAYAKHDLQQAGFVYEEALAIMPKTGMRTSIAQVGYAQVLLELNELTKAKPLLHAALDVRSGKFPPQHSMIAEVQALLALIDSKTGDDKEAIALLSSAIGVLKKHPLYRFGYRHRLLQLGDDRLAALNVAR